MNDWINDQVENRDTNEKQPAFTFQVCSKSPENYPLEPTPPGFQAGGGGAATAAIGPEPKQTSMVKIVEYNNVVITDFNSKDPNLTSIKMNTEVLITSLSNSPYRAFERLAGIELKGDPSIKGIIPTNILRVQPKPLRQEPNLTDKTVPEKTVNLGNGNET